MSKKTQSRNLTLSQLPKELVEKLNVEQQQKLTALLNDGKEVSVVNGQLFVTEKVESPEIESWKEGEKISGQIIDVKESSNYKNNMLGTFLQKDGSTVVKPLTKVLYSRMHPYLSQRGTIFMIECLGKVKGKQYSYDDFAVTVSVPLF